MSIINLTKRPQIYPAGMESMVDEDPNTYSTITLDKTWENDDKDFLVYRFNFSEIPVGSTINNITLNIRSSTEKHIRLILYATRYYDLSGTWSTIDKAIPNTIIQQADQEVSNYSISGTSNLGTWTRDELAANAICGIGFYFRVHRDGYTKDAYGNETWEIPVYDRSCYLYDLSVTVEYTLPQYLIAIQSDNLIMGTVKGGGTYDHGSNIQIEATPNPGYKFKQWNDENTSQIRQIEVLEPKTYIAYFEPKEIKITFHESYEDPVISHTKNITYLDFYNPTSLYKPKRKGYTFLGWFRKKPACDTVVLENNSFIILPQTYKYENNLAINFDAVMEDWSQIVDKQILSCTESGGWGLGHYANADGHGFEVYINNIGYVGLNFELEKLSPGWHNFKILITNNFVCGTVDETIELYRIKTLNENTDNHIVYNPTNTIIVGAEASGDPSVADGYFFNNGISSVFIGQSLEEITPIDNEQMLDTEDFTLYAGWKRNYYNLDAYPIPSDVGLINGQKEYHRYVPENTTLTISTTPDYGSTFIKWTYNGIDTVLNQSFRWTAIADTELQAIYNCPIKIFVGKKRLKKAFLGTIPIKAIYKGTTKIYEIF